MDLTTSLNKAAQASSSSRQITAWLTQAREAASSPNPNQAARECGLTCHIAEAFPATLLFLFRWIEQGQEKTSDAFLQTLSANNLAGGDTSARAIPLAAILTTAGCPFPTDLYQQLTHHQEIEDLITQVQDAD